MKEENKKSKKKILLYYLILAACLLVIAAVTVTVIFTVNRTPSDITIDNPGDDGNNDNQGGDNTGDNSGGNNDGNQDDNQGGNNQGGDDDNTPTTNPTDFTLPVGSTSVTSKFVFSYDVTLDRYCVHRGIDFEATAGDEVYAVMNGTVTDIVANHILGENYITLTHDDGVTSTYKYVEANSTLKVGDKVTRGDVIGTVTAASGMEMKQGDHLHFEIRVNGKLADPESYLQIIEK